MNNMNSILKKKFNSLKEILASHSNFTLIVLNVVIIVLLWMVDDVTDNHSNLVSITICLLIIIIQVSYIYKLKKHLKEEKLSRIIISSEEDIKREKFDIVALITGLIQVWLILFYLINKLWLHVLDLKLVDLLLSIALILMLFVQIYYVQKIKKNVYTSNSANIKSYNSESNWSFFIILGIGLALVYIQFSPYLGDYKETLNVVLPPLYTTCFSIVVLQIFYTRRTEKYFWAEVKEIVLQFFTDNNDNLLNRLDADRIKRVIDNCYKSLFGKELAEGIRSVAYSNQLELGCYRTNFKYEVAIKRTDENSKSSEFSVAQMLQYKKVMRPSRGKWKYIVSIFDFERDPFQESSKDEIVFFWESLRSKDLIEDLKNAFKIANRIRMWYENKELDISHRKDELLKKMIDCFRRDGGGEESYECVKEVILYIKDVDAEFNELVEGRKNIQKKKHEIITRFLSNKIVKESMSHDEVIIPDLTGVIQDIIITALLGYTLDHLGTSGQLEKSECEEMKTCYLTEAGNSSYIKGVKLLSPIKDSYFKEEPDDYISLYYLLKCDYLTENQCSFYWKFCEPIIAPYCSVHFDGIDVSKVQVVQYFADNKEIVDVNPKLKRVAFKSDSTFLPESGVYMHWEH